MVAPPQTIYSSIGGQPHDSGEWLERENPAYPARIVGRVSVASVDAVGEAIVAADHAFERWRQVPLSSRVEQVLRACETVAQQESALAELLVLELGKVRAGAVGELRFAHTYAQYCARTVVDVLKPRTTTDRQGRLEVEHEPFGVVAAITPWNAPVILAFLKVIPALLTGNTVVLKPSPLAPLTITKALQSMGDHLPAGVLSVINGDGPVGDALVSHPLTRKVAFTGGSTVGRKIMATAARNLIPSVMELGGNDAAIFLSDADLSAPNMTRAVLGSFLSGGQVCMAAKRLYVHSSRMEEFVDSYLRIARDALVVGDPAEEGVTLGPLVSRAQVDRTRALSDAAVADGAHAHVLGTVRSATVVEQGYFMLPTLLTGVGDGDRVVTEEQFGPVVPVMAFDDEDEAVRRANDDPLGLGSSVWSADVDHAFEVGRRLQTGYTFINSHNRFGMTLQAPFGGVKGSGFGREYGPDGVLEYVQTHSLYAPSLNDEAVGGYPEPGDD
ncbi:aldehyde dehydrogenase family protein [Dactylosporangium sp. NPDC050688]|uniref:aldehyde dehydrogenase family protein n=1 Tax=Dactylosporangium sp. NPDC050688 TaxID=3157217 RepID=UPI0033CB1FE5